MDWALKVLKQQFKYLWETNEKVALGGTVFNDITGPTSRIGGTISYAYTLPINGKLNFSLAISGGFTQFRLIKSTISVQQADDPFIQGGDIVRTLPDAIFALNFFTEKWYLGLSVPQLLSTELNLMDEDFEEDTILQVLMGNYQVMFLF